MLPAQRPHQTVSTTFTWFTMWAHPLSTIPKRNHCITMMIMIGVRMRCAEIADLLSPLGIVPSTNVEIAASPRMNPAQGMVDKESRVTSRGPYAQWIG